MTIKDVRATNANSEENKPHSTPSFILLFTLMMFSKSELVYFFLTCGYLHDSRSKLHDVLQEAQPEGYIRHWTSAESQLPPPEHSGDQPHLHQRHSAPLWRDHAGEALFPRQGSDPSHHREPYAWAAVPAEEADQIPPVPQLHHQLWCWCRYLNQVFCVVFFSLFIAHRFAW